MKKRVTFFLEEKDLDDLKAMAAEATAFNGEDVSYGSLIRAGVRRQLETFRADHEASIFEEEDR